MNKSTQMSRLIQSFFESHLPSERGLRSHTILSYRDTIKLFLKDLSKKTSKPIQRLTLGDFTAKNVLLFLKSIEENGNSIKTRNQRLAVLKSLFTYLMNMDPSRLGQYEKVFHIKSKRAPYKPPEYLTEKELRALLAAPDPQTDKGKRDYLILLFAYNTGSRVQELCGLKVKHLRFEKPYLVNLHGKGQKVRQVPLWQETIKLLLEATATKEENDFVFVNRNKKPFSRFGIRYILSTYAKIAAHSCKSIAKKKVSPHILRHTTAMHLLQSGVDITIIKAWLGHVDLKTTHGYIEIDLKMKEKAMQKNRSKASLRKFKSMMRKESDLIKWLETF